MKPTFLLIPVFLLSIVSASAQSTWFPFTLPWDDASKTAVDASDLLVDYPGQDPATVIDSRGYLRAGSDGHFYFAKTGKRARFWGVNLTFNASFPPCPDEPLRSGEYPDDRVSDKVARRLAKLGVNVVRFHHMDTSVSPNGIWDRKYYPNDTQHLDPAQVKRLDYLIYQLRRNGIYANLNLKVGRHFGPGDGLPDTNLFSTGPTYFQGVSHFNQRMIELQRDYARQLLAHRNPYTGLTYAEDPAVAFVEIANEDSMFGNLLLDELNYQAGFVGSLPERYSLELDALWNTWLASRYSSRQALENAWKSAESVDDTANKMRNSGFESGMADWSVQPIGGAKVSTKVEAGTGPDGSAALRVEVTTDGVNWHVQCIQNGHAVEKDRSYEFSFYAKAVSPGEITVDIMKGISPWNNYGLSKAFQITTSWKRYTAFFTANETEPANIRPTFELGAISNTIWIDQVVFRRSILKGLETDESFDLGTIRRPARADLGGYTPARTVDLFRFYTDIDAQYFGGMYRYLKDDLGIRALVTGTAPWWAYLGDVATQSKMDFVDGHFYWDHPSWPPGKAWAATGWLINNTPWINQFQNFIGLAAQAVEGKPFTVSEFNDVFPNRYALEGPLLVAITANLQDWDAVYLFDYSGSTASYDDAFTTSFFSLAGNPVKTAQLPICSRIFLKRQSAVASSNIEINLNQDELALGFAKGRVNAADFLESKGLDRRTFLRERLRLRTFNRPEAVAIDHTLPAGNVISSGGELLWNRENTLASFMRIQGSALQGAIGFIKGLAMDMGDWAFQAGGSSPDHLAVLLQARDGEPLRESRRMIFTVWTEHENTGMVWNDARTSVDNRWGSAPPIVRPAQVDLDLRFASARTLRVFPLDEKGNRGNPLSVQAVDNSYRVQIDTGRDQTVWYEIELNDPLASAEFTVPAQGLFQLYSGDAASDQPTVGWAELENRTGGSIQPAALLEYSSRGILTSVVRLPASNPATQSRAPVIRNAVVDTAVAILNRQGTPNTINMRLLDSAGVAQGAVQTEILQPGEARAFFVREKFDVKEGFEGLLELSAAAPFLPLTLRSIATSAGDFALTPYPLESTEKGPMYFAHLTADAAYSSDILLWNSQSDSIKARLEFHTPDGKAASPAGQPASQEIQLQPGQLRRVALPRIPVGFNGYARLLLSVGTALPSATAVITRWEDGGPVSEVGIPATAGIGEEILPMADRPSQRTALALLNPGAAPVNVDLELFGTENSQSLPGKVRISLAAGEKRAFFLYEVFPNLPTYLTSVLRVRASAGIATLALLGITNERGNFLMAALTGEPGRQPLSAGAVATIPRYATGAGYRTVLWLLPAQIGSDPTQGQVRFYDSKGVSIPLVFR